MKMKLNIIPKFTVLIVLTLLVVATSCERDPSDEVVFATFPNTPDVFTDDPVGLTDEFFESFAPSEGYNTDDTFDVVSDVAFEGSSSIRIDVPSSDNPNGFLAGGIFRDRGDGRDLTGYDALTFWAKASTTATLASVGFGADFVEDKFTAVRTGIELTTNWTKYIIPIPDASKLIQERGLFSYIAAPFDVLGDGPNGNEIGWTFWMDEIRFENLGTIAQGRPRMESGQDVQVQSFSGSTFDLASRGLTQTLNVDGSNITVNAAPAYFTFSSSDNSIASVSDSGIVTVNNGIGTALITASIAGEPAMGSLEITSIGTLPAAPIPGEDAAGVISVYSDTYTAATGINFAPGFGGSTTSASEAEISGDNVLVYANNNFTGIIFDNPVDTSTLNTMHVDVFVNSPGVEVEFQIRDVGPNGEINTNIFTGQPEEDDVDRRFTASGLTVGQWNSIDIPLDGSLTNQRDNIGAIILVNGPDFILDNIYFFTSN